MWFPLGVVIACAGSLAPAALVAPARIGVLNLLVPVLACLAGGAIAGRSLRLGPRGTIGFALAFALTLPVLILNVIGIQGQGGHERLTALAADLGGSGAGAFGLMGFVGPAIARIGWRDLVISTVVFGCAGCAGGVVLAVCVWATGAGQPDVNRLLLALGAIAFVVLPAAVGGSVLTRRLAAHRRPDNPAA